MDVREHNLYQPNARAIDKLLMRRSDLRVTALNWTSCLFRHLTTLKIELETCLRSKSICTLSTAKDIHSYERYHSLVVDVSLNTGLAIHLMNVFGPCCSSFSKPIQYTDTITHSEEMTYMACRYLHVATEACQKLSPGQDNSLGPENCNMFLFCSFFLFAAILDGTQTGSNLEGSN